MEYSKELIDENNDLKKALAITKHMLEESQRENQKVNVIYKETKENHQNLKKENKEMSANLLEVSENKRQLELKMSESLRGLQLALNMKQKEMEDLQNKLLSSVDIELERMKIKNKLELIYTQENEFKQNKIINLNEDLDDTKRNYELINTKYHSMVRDHEKTVDFIKQAHKTQVNELMDEIGNLQNQVSTDIYKDKYHEIKRESEHTKGTLSLLEKEINQTSLELETVRREKNDLLINNSNLLDKERSDKRELKSMYDKLSVRSKYLEEDSQIHSQKTDSSLQQPLYPQKIHVP